MLFSLSWFSGKHFPFRDVRRMGKKSVNLFTFLIDWLVFKVTSIISNSLYRGLTCIDSYLQEHSELNISWVNMYWYTRGILNSGVNKFYGILVVLLSKILPLLKGEGYWKYKPNFPSDMDPVYGLWNTSDNVCQWPLKSINNCSV